MGLYFLWLAWLNSGRRVRLVSGGSDAAALGAGLAGLVLVGPMELLAPESAFLVYGSTAWGMLLVMYGLIVSLVVLVQPPSIVLYNVAFPQVRTLVAQALESLEVETRWAGATVFVPSLGVEFSVDAFGSMRNTLLVATHSYQNLDGWWRLERILRSRLPDVVVGWNPRGPLFAGLACGLLGWCAWSAVYIPALLASK